MPIFASESSISRGEVLLVALPDHLKAPVKFAMLTGWRMESEVLTLTWKQVDFDAGTVRLEPGTTKNSEGRIFPFGTWPELRDLLLEQRKRSLGISWVFHKGGRKMPQRWRDDWHRACREVGLTGTIPHDLRRSAVRRLERARVPRSVAMMLTGHKSETVYRRYAIAAEEDLREGVSKLADLMGTKRAQTTSKAQ